MGATPSKSNTNPPDQVAAELLQLGQLEHDALDTRLRVAASRGGSIAAKARWAKATEQQRERAARNAGIGNRKRSKEDLQAHARHAAEARWEAARMKTRSTKTQSRKKRSTKKQEKS
jgi:hypothetical protein